MKFSPLHRPSWTLLLLLLCFGLLGPVLQASDLSITASTVKPSANAIIREAIAGEALTAGQMVYKSTTDLKLYKADCDHASAGNRNAVGIIINSASLGTRVHYVTEDPDLTIGATVTHGVAYVLSATAGGLAPLADATTGWYVTIVMVGKPTNKVAFRAQGIRSDTAL